MAKNLHFEIVKEKISALNQIGCDYRYYVIAVPINETGICFEFDSEDKARAYIKEQGGKNNGKK